MNIAHNPPRFLYAHQIEEGDRIEWFCFGYYRTAKVKTVRVKGSKPNHLCIFILDDDSRQWFFNDTKIKVYFN
jgi:hypothetical protein